MPNWIHITTISSKTSQDLAVECNISSGVAIHKNFVTYAGIFLFQIIDAYFHGNAFMEACIRLRLKYVFEKTNLVYMGKV